MGIKTGILGFDELVGGGFPEGNSVLVCGKIGTGKSTFAMQYLAKGITDYGDLGVLVSLERDKRDLFQDASAFDWHLQRLEKEGTLQILGGPISSVSREMEKAKAKIEDFISEVVEVVETSESRRVALERLDLLSMFSPDESEFKVQLSDLRERLAELGCTSVLTSEIREGREELSGLGAEEILDGVIVLYYEGEGLTRDRALEIRKMRGTEHSNRLHFFDIIENKGIVIEKIPEKHK
jgi:KaiC/GvpD/RAD55 family RecA-like ATPase